MMFVRPIFFSPINQNLVATNSDYTTVGNSGGFRNSLEGVQKFYYGPLEIIFYITGWSRHDSCESITHLTPSCKKFKNDGKIDVCASNFFFFVKSKHCCHKLILHGSWVEHNFSTCISARFEFTVGSLFYIHLYLSSTCGY